MAEKMMELWIICVYTSTEEQERKKQWEFLKDRRSRWGSMWIVGGISIILLTMKEKKVGRRMPDSNFDDFKEFIT